MPDMSPSERYAASRLVVSHPYVDDFRGSRDFDLDPFQVSACQRVEEGDSVLVAAPTGAGKTIVAEFAIHLAMTGPATDSRVFFTTPMKALSNQKYNELVDRWGTENVGLLTGDTNINGNARLVVMTTEVLRNMLYADARSLSDLAFVIMDEVHYLADRFRGAVWEEVIIHLPATVKLVCLSATVSNAEEFADWLGAVRGDVSLVLSEERPVPLDQHVIVSGKLIDLFDSRGQASANRVNPELQRLAQAAMRAPHQRGRSSRLGGSRGRPSTSFAPVRGRIDRPDVIELLGERQLLPAIFFIFSRAGCDQAVRQCVQSGVRLTDTHEREEIRAIVDERCRTLLDEDLGVLGYWKWLEGLERGVAAHHAGLLPAFKEVVEELFQEKLVKVVFATETLALGINMPARSVVLEKLEKFNGEARVPLTAGEYTQITGRAGRRGIDVEGHAVVQWNGNNDPQSIANLASRRTYPLNSSFRPTYNMAVNLVSQFGRNRTRQILESSFAQFQADRSVVDLARKVKQQQESLVGFEKPMSCHLGNFAEYAAIRRSLTDKERAAITANDSRASRDRRAAELNRLRKNMRAHSCHACPEREEHARWAERWWRLRRDTDNVVRQINERTGAVARTFDRVCDVLLERGYLLLSPDGDLERTPEGEILARIYGDRDLLVAESLRSGIWDGLDVPSLAALVCAIVFEPRREEGDISERRLPRGAFVEALTATGLLWSELDDIEQRVKLPGTQPISPGISRAMYRWAQGDSLDDVLFEADMPAGDFVRWTKQTIDLLDQISHVSSSRVSATARLALDAVRRGVVAYASVGSL